MMAWKEQNNSEKMTISQKCLLVFLVLMPMIWVFAGYINFISTQNVWRWGLYIALTLTLLSIGFIFWGLAVGQLKRAPGSTTSGRQRFIIVLFAPLLIFVTWWMLAVQVVPDIITQISGTSKQIVTPMQATYRSIRGSCDYKLRGYILKRTMTNYLCTSPSSISSFPSNILVTLQVKESAWGMHIESAVETDLSNKQGESPPKTD